MENLSNPLEKQNTQDSLQNKKELVFQSVALDEFFEDDQYIEKNDEYNTNIIVLSPKERELVDMVFERLRVASPEALENISARMTDLERLAATIARFPSLLQKQVIAEQEVRTQESLVKALLDFKNGDRMLHLPTKAILGKGFLVAKFHAFVSISKTARIQHFNKKELEQLRTATLRVMFTIMAEDVYLSLLGDTSIPADIREQIATSLIILWEHRSDQTVADIAPVLEAVWTVRDKIVPAFGTMVGTSELLRLTIELDEQWTAFIKNKLEDSDVSQSLEEFLFGLSFEQIGFLKNKIKEQKYLSISREDVYALLGEHIPVDIEFDPRNFYLRYTVRRDNARARSRMNLEGPHKTLEDHFVKFILEQNREKQHNDAYAD